MVRLSPSEADLPALLVVVADETFDQADCESTEVWAPLHAWRTLGQLGSALAAEPLIAEFDRLCEDDRALPELSTVMGMLGAHAIDPLATCLNDPRHTAERRLDRVPESSLAVRHRPESPHSG